MYVYLFYLRIIIPVSFIYKNIFIQNKGDTALQFAKKAIQERNRDEDVKKLKLDELDSITEEWENIKKEVKKYFLLFFLR